MRNILKSFVVLGIALALTACAPSLHSFYTDKDVVFNDSLLGMWVEDSGGICKFAKSGDNNYELLVMDDKPARFEARLFEIGDVTFLDLYPKPLSDEVSLYPENYAPAHSLARVTIDKNMLSIAMMDGNWLKELSDRGRLELKHERINTDMVVLTASTRELQAFALRHANDKEAFGDASVFHRIQTGE